MRAFLIDDEKMYFKILSPVLKKAGHILGYASSGQEGLDTIAAFDPDVIILDIRLGDMLGFDVLERLRSDPHFSRVPVIFVTSYDELESKLKAFSLGAEDYLTKPFKPDELLARLEILARRREYLKIAETITDTEATSATIVAVHSLRGGVGCTSLSINLALAYNLIWQRPSLLIDSVLTAGQVALFLNASPKSTLEDLADKPLNAIDKDMIRGLVNLHKSGIRYVASPKVPVSFEAINEIYPKVIEELRRLNDLIILDTPHDFSDVSILSLDAADHILFVISPEMGSMRSAIFALRTYERLGYPPEKILIALNHNTPSSGLKKAQIEKAISHEVNFEFSYAQEVSESINTGEPFLTAYPTLPISSQVEVCAYQLSRDALRNVPPAVRTQSWKNVIKRLGRKM